MLGRKYIIVASLLLLVLLLLNLPLGASQRVKAGTRDNMSPFHRALLYVTDKIHGVGWAIAGAWHADGTEADLRSQIAELKRQLWLRQNLEEENQALRDLVGFERRKRDRLVPCAVVSRGDTSGWWQTVRLNRGSLDGLRPNLAVVTTEGLVGRTTEVSQHTCDVILITDPNSKVACKLQRTGAFGIMRGAGITATGKEKLDVLYSVQPGMLNYLPGDIQIFRGEDVVTSGLGGIYPEGLPVGRVKTVREDYSQLYLQAEILPAAELRRLRYVYVIIPELESP
ncbi:MAG: rod shape-determining protein MreC [Verrucomicrobia bacterium]|nr:rod shape-determining protein MreC [Verrucomicrobiota bacterium]